MVLEEQDVYSHDDASQYEPVDSADRLSADGSHPQCPLPKISLLPESRRAPLHVEQAGYPTGATAGPPIDPTTGS